MGTIQRGPSRSATARACSAPIVGPPPTGMNSRSTAPIASACSARSERWPKSPMWTVRRPSSSKQKIVLGPRLVPATGSCSEATATTSPMGDPRRPAVARRTAGSPSIASTPLWSACSCVTSTRSAATPSIGGYSNRSPRAASPSIRPNESIRTDVPPAVKRNADWPYHSTSMLLRRERTGQHRALLTVVVAAAAHERRRGGNQTRDDREREGHVQSRVEGPGDQLRGERGPGQHVAIGGGKARESGGADEVLDRVVAEERREQDRDRRKLRNPVRGRVRDAVGLQPARQRVREVGREPDDHQREEDPDRDHLRRVLEGLVHAAAGAAVACRQAVHHGRAVR